MLPLVLASAEEAPSATLPLRAKSSVVRAFPTCTCQLYPRTYASLYTKCSIISLRSPLSAAAKRTHQFACLC